MVKWLKRMPIDHHDGFLESLNNKFRASGVLPAFLPPSSTAPKVFRARRKFESYELEVSPKSICQILFQES